MRRIHPADLPPLPLLYSRSLSRKMADVARLLCAILRDTLGSADELAHTTFAAADLTRQTVAAFPQFRNKGRAGEYLLHDPQHHFAFVSRDEVVLLDDERDAAAFFEARTRATRTLSTLLAPYKEPTNGR